MSDTSNPMALTEFEQTYPPLRKDDERSVERVSLAPLSPEDALRGLLATPPRDQD